MSEQTADVVWPVADGTRVPFEIYTSQDVFNREQERIFRGPLWNYVALEAEVPAPGDFKTSFVGDTPVVVSRAQDGGVHVFVNRCAHRGATVQRHASGNTKEHRCVYHQWCYDGRGDLVSVPYRRATTGFGGYAPDFDMQAHGLRKLHVASRKGVIFATFDPAAPSLEDFLEEPLLDAIDRLFSREVKVLGHMRQRIHGNWKLYVENTRDPYHAALLHGFHATFGTYRSNQKGFRGHDRARAHSAGGKYGDDFAKPATAEAVGDDNYIAGYSLSDPSLMAGRPDFNDNINLAITSIFPSVVVQQIMNTLATRHIRPKAPDDFELYWTYFGYVDDDADTTAARLKQANLVGPAGLISMEDGEAVELIQRAIVRDGKDCAFLEFGPVNADPEQDKQGEDAVRAFWRYYRRDHGVMIPPGIYEAILALEYRYARLLDDDRLEEWPDLFVERGVYKVIPRENWHREPKLAILFCDSRAMMMDRIRSLRTANIYNIHYPRHVVTNVEVLGARGDEYDVAAAFTVYQTDLEGQTKLFSVGQYLDVITFNGGEPRFREKVAVCDTFNIPNLLAIPL